MKRQYNILKVTLAVLVTGMASSSINADVVNGTATASLVAPLSISEDTQMNFGTVSGGPDVGTVVLATDNSRTTSGDAQIVEPGGVAGVFTITGEALQTVIISFTDGTLVGPGNAMAVNTFTDSLTTAGTAVLTAATEIMRVGATLNVGAGQLAGSYTTTGGTPYTITVNYQ